MNDFFGWANEAVPPMANNAQMGMDPTAGMSTDDMVKAGMFMRPNAQGQSPDVQQSFRAFMSQKQNVAGQGPRMVAKRVNQLGQQAAQNAQGQVSPGQVMPGQQVPGQAVQGQPMSRMDMAPRMNRPA